MIIIMTIIIITKKWDDAVGRYSENILYDSCDQHISLCKWYSFNKRNT